MISLPEFEDAVGFYPYSCYSSTNALFTEDVEEFVDKDGLVHIGPDKQNVGT